MGSPALADSYPADRNGGGHVVRSVGQVRKGGTRALDFRVKMDSLQVTEASETGMAGRVLPGNLETAGCGGSRHQAALWRSWPPCGRAGLTRRPRFPPGRASLPDSGGGTGRGPELLLFPGDQPKTSKPKAGG